MGKEAENSEKTFHNFIIAQTFFKVKFLRGWRRLSPTFRLRAKRWPPSPVSSAAFQLCLSPTPTLSPLRYEMLCDPHFLTNPKKTGAGENGESACKTRYIPRVALRLLEILADAVEGFFSFEYG